MPIPEEALALLQGAVETEEDRIAFEEGYKLALVSDNHARFTGTADTRFGIIFDMPDQDGTWLADRILPRSGDSVEVKDSAFLLGAVTAALARKADQGLSRPSELA